MMIHLRESIVFKICLPLLAFFAFSSAAHAYGYDDDCYNCEVEFARPAVSSLESQLSAIEDVITVEEKILTTGAKYGPFGALNLGDLDIFVKTTTSGEIVAFHVRGKVGAFGFNEVINETMSFDEALRQPMSFSKPGESEPIVSLAVSPDFNEYGGEMVIRYKEGKKYRQEKVILSQAMGTYGLYKDEVANGNRVERVQLYLGGTSPESLKLKDVKYVMN